MSRVKDAAALILVSMWILVVVSACETAKHAEVMSAEDLRAQAQKSSAGGAGTDEQSGIALSEPSMSQETIDVTESSKSPPGEMDAGEMVFAKPPLPTPSLPGGPSADYVPELPPQPSLADEGRSAGGTTESIVEEGTGPTGEFDPGPTGFEGRQFVRAVTPSNLVPEKPPLPHMEGEPFIQALTPSDFVPEDEAPAPSQGKEIERMTDKDSSPMEKPADEAGGDIVASLSDQTEPSMQPLDQGDLPQDSTTKRLHARLAHVFFDFDQYSIRPDAVSVLEKNAELLNNKFKHSSVLIEGHCDERGTVEYNMELGKRRAQAVKDYLADLGVNESRILIVSYGKERPFCRESKPKCWQQNRRGHFVLQ